MGNPTIYYYPSDSSADLETIDLGEPLSDLPIDFVERDVSDGTTLYGTTSRTVFTGRRRIRIVNSNFNDESVKRQLQSLEAHLQAGKTISIALDSDKVWAATAESSKVHHGRSAIQTDGGNRFTAYGGSNALASGDELCIQSANPEYSYEFIPVQGALTTGSLVTLQRDLRYDYDEGPVWVRYRDFWPALKLPQDQLGQQIVTHTHRIAWTLDMELVENHAVLDSLAAQVVGLGGSSSRTGQVSLDGSVTHTRHTGFGGGSRSARGTPSKFGL